jgi:hypothetical protein
MRSQLVFDASIHIPNRYLLCRTLDVWSRAVHRAGSMGSSINQALQVVCSQKDQPGDVAPGSKAPTPAASDLFSTSEERMAG